ncbi:hypothetical protein [Stenotrophomonas sp. SY1]|uniref:hypothetical protein n=1 Tax=Stenotrophomonas sp. SY1 TaxID=477235 RepID=UPI001E4365F5|nr:hypothetical protein [Stenotrophomonas sp. SY1]MCD9087862.1 hypothetical protein [Stenotrophomonas sp. SY1]
MAVLNAHGRASSERGRAKLDSLRFVDSAVDSGAIRYVVQDGVLQWMTLATFSKRTADSWVSVRTLCESRHPAAVLPSGKKPLLVKQLLEHLGGGDDNGLVLGKPISLTNADMALAIDLIAGKAGNRLPIVYVSAPSSNKHFVRIGNLSHKLAGMAHLVVEPSRSFSWRLRDQVNSENVYGGAVGIYWPDSGGRRSQFRRGDFSSINEMESAIEEEVRAALINRRPLDRCTFSSVDSAISRSEIEHYKKEGNKGFDEYAAHFDVELLAKDESLESAEREIARLKAEIREHERIRAMQGGVSFSVGQEADLYAGEILDVVLGAVQAEVGRAIQGTRRRHIVEAILESNKVVGMAPRSREKIKEALRDYRSLDKKTIAILEELGFVVEKGNHPRIVFQGDERYAFVLPGTGGDWRGGMNAASDLANLVF